MWVLKRKRVFSLYGTVIKTYPTFIKIFEDFFFFLLLLAGFIHTNNCSDISSHVICLQNKLMQHFVVKAHIIDTLNRCILLHSHIMNEMRHLMIPEVSPQISVRTEYFYLLFFFFFVIAFAISKCLYLYNWRQYSLYGILFTVLVSCVLLDEVGI